MITILLEKIITILEGWIQNFTSHAQHVEDKLDSLDQTASDIETNTDALPDIKNNTGAVITPIQNIKSNTDSITTSSQTSANNTTAIVNNIGTLSTNTGRAAAFAEDCANNTLDIKDKVTTIASDTTQIRATDNNIYGTINDIKDILQYFFLFNIVTEDSSGVIANFDTDLDDYIQALKVTIPADPTGYTGFNLKKTGRNLCPSQSLSQIGNSIYIRNKNYPLYFYPGTYTIKNDGVSSYTYFRKDTDSANTVIHTANTNKGTFTITEAGYYNIWFFGSNLSSSNFYNITIERGNVEPSYEEYKEITYPISFGSTITDGAEADLLSGLVKVNTTPASYIQIQPIAIRTYKGVNNIFSDIGTSALTYRETLKHYLDKNNQ